MQAAPGEANVTASVLNAGRVLVIEDLLNSNYIAPRIAALFPARSIMGLPLVSDGRWLGAAIITFPETHPFSQSEIALGEQAAAQIALALAKTQLFETERQRTAQLARANRLITAFSQVATEVASSKDPETVLEKLGQELQRLGLYCLVALRMPETGHLAMHALFGAEASLAEKLAGQPLRRAHLPPGQFPCYEEVIVNHRAVYLASAGAILEAVLPGLRGSTQEEVAGLVGALPGNRLCFLPLVAGEQALGALCIWGPDLEETDLPAGALFAGQIAVALENARLYAQIRYMAVTDELTGLYNRRGFFEFGWHEAERAARSGHPLAAVMIDIDHFKHINDQFGHAVGDHVLRRFADCCRANVREIDVIGRMGGEEFLILLPENDLAGARAVAERLRRQIVELAIQTDLGTVRITASVGVAAAAGEARDLAALIRRADDALYIAKNSGRNQVASLEACAE
jgi:diguanylate cyclase (GGDEF)-like protein